MSRWWRVRQFGERVLDFVPFADQLHDAAGRLRRGNFLELVRRDFVRAKLARWRFFREATETSLRGTRVLDVGTGWTGNDLILLHLFGVAAIDTVDRFPHLRVDALRASVAGLRDQLPALEGEFGLSDSAARLEAIPLDSVPRALAHLHVTMHVGREVARLGLAEGTYDVFFSHSTLQCLPVPEFERTLAAAARLVRAGGLAFNDIRFVDNNYQGGEAPPPFGFLAHSDLVWGVIQSRRFNYHNRLRHVEVLECFAAAGFELVREATVIAEPAALSGVRVHPRFARVPAEDLRIVNATMVHRRS
jgi:hypothetical protein